MRWGQITEELNEEFQNYCQNGSQCRQKQVNSARFNSENKSKNNWTPE